MKRSLIYARISRDPLKTELGVDRQKTLCRKLCATNGWSIVEEITDNDQSASTGRRRPGFERLKTMLASGEVDVLVAWHPDRITRHPRELEDLIDLLNSTGTEVATVVGGVYDLTTSAGRMTARLIGTVAKHESEQKGERLRAKHLSLAQAGKPAGGSIRPFGYSDPARSAIVPEEAAVIRGAVELFLSGASIAETVRWARATGFTGTTGKPFGTVTLKRIMSSALVGGKREHGGQLYDAEWEPILSWDQVLAVRARLVAPERRPSQRYLLSGIARCAVCGAALIAQPRGPDHRSYRCPPKQNPAGPSGCGGVRMKADPFEEDVTDRVMLWVTDENRLGKPPRQVQAASKRTELTKRLKAIETQLDRLLALYLKSSLSQDELDRARYDLLAQRADVEGALASLAAPSASDGLLGTRQTLSATRERWELLTINQRRAFLREFDAQITVGRGLRGRNTYDSSRVTFTMSVAALWEPEQ